MRGRRIQFKSVLNKFTAILLAAALMPTYPGVEAAEVPEASFSGINNSDVILNNLNYNDIKKSPEWIKEAVYETGALNLVKSYGNKNFGLSTVLSKEDAIASIYTALGREADAKKLAETLDNARQNQDKKKNPLNMWADGFLQLAANEGLISRQDFTDAMEQDQTSLGADSFHRSAAAKRQDVAYWMAKAFKLNPVYDQQNMYNNFKDWKSADPIKIPYIEAVLQNNIINGDGSGSFKPLSSVNRGQTAQIIKNSEDFILPLTGLDRKTGTIEDISTMGDYSKGSTVNKVYNVRNSNGMLHTITVQYTADTGGSRNESTGSKLNKGIKDLVVLKKGVLGRSSMLAAGDRIEYITAADNTVKFLKVLSSVYDTKYYVARVNSIDNGRRAINTAIFFKLDYPDIDLSKTNISFDPGMENATMVYTYSNNIVVYDDKAKTDIQSIKPEDYVIITVKNNIVTGIKTLDMGHEEENNVVQGIVEDNNPQLGYITLYNEDGTGVSSDSKKDMYVLRTYNYGNQNGLEVFKNHEKASIDEIEAGDTVFLKLDSKGNVESLSAADNYTVKYGKVISKGPSTLGVRYDNGAEQVLGVDKSVLVISDKKLVGYSRLKNGDKVRLLMNVTNKSTKIKEIAIEGDESLISNIYKGTVLNIDKTSNKLIVQNLQPFYNGQWSIAEKNGSTGLRLAEEYRMFFDNKEISPDKAKKYLQENEAYIAVQKDYGGEERAVFISFRNDEDTEDEPYDDSVTYSIPGTGEFSISKKLERIKNGDGTIVIKDGRLVSVNTISAGDNAYIVATRSYDSGDYLAGIVQINDKSNTGAVQLYRARIKQISEMKNFTVESFSQLNGLNWEYSNTPKTFNMTQNTRIVGDSGVENQRGFIDYGTGSYANRTVYIIADSVNALLVSTAPYGTVNAKGEVYDITGATVGDEGTLLSEPTGLKLASAKVYNLSQHMWVDSKDMTLNMLTNSIVMKDGKIIKPSEIRKGDKLRVIKKDSAETGDAYIILVEN